MADKKIKARPTLYKGIRMRSRLEADYAAWLDSGGTVWEYEPQCYAGPTGQWLPDFLEKSRNGKWNWLTEIKPASTKQDEIDPILERMSVAWLSEPRAVLALRFWEYGGTEEHEHLIGIGGEWWFVGIGDDGSQQAYLWPGMGQLRRLVVEAAAEMDDQALEKAAREVIAAWNDGCTSNEGFITPAPMDAEVVIKAAIAAGVPVMGAVWDAFYENDLSPEERWSFIVQRISLCPAGPTP